MSYLKKINLKEKIFMVKDFFYELVFIKRSLYAVGASLILSFFIVQTSTPLFYVSSTLREAVAPAEGPANGLGAATALFGAALDTGGATDEFDSNMNSYVLAQRMSVEDLNESM